MWVKKQRYFNSSALSRHRGIMTIEGEGDNGGAGGGSTQDSGGNNQGGNDGSGGNGDPNQNNSGGGFDFKTFWQEPPAPKSESSSADNGNGGGGQQQQQDAFQTDWNRRFEAVKFNPVFDDKVAAEVGEGKFDTINANIQSQMRSAVERSIELMVPLMKAYGDKIQTQMREAVSGDFNKRDDDKTLVDSFPMAKDPALRPMIQGVFDRAMQHNKGDRAKAVEMAKGFLSYMGTNAHQDLGIQTPPRGAGDEYGGNAESSKSLVDELLGRK